MFELLIADDPNNAAVALIAVLGWIIVGIVQFILFIAALVSIVRSPRYTGGGKFLWVAVVFFAPFFGAVGWFVAGRTAKIRTAVE